MNDIDKLKHLVEHWAEHNKEHARTYLDWAQRAAALGRTDLSDVLKEIAEEASRIDGLFEKAGKMLG